MAVAELTATELVQVCAVCARTHRLPLAALRVGHGEGAQREDGTIALPPCAHCEASEFLFRSPEGAPPHPLPGSPGHLHRLLVDHLHGRLTAAAGGDEGSPGRPRPGPSDEELVRWFPGGLRLPPARAEALRPTGPDDPTLAAIAAGRRRG
ncbi:MAG TPA: hypothetical protein VFS00_03315 [Polyangiaceae bacterium]|nr:hypothetical protein [Polyangiaceae bacterium]